MNPSSPISWLYVFGLLGQNSKKQDFEVISGYLEKRITVQGVIPRRFKRKTFFETDERTHERTNRLMDGRTDRRDGGNSDLDVLERALWALASSSGGAACPGGTQGQPRG